MVEFTPKQKTQMLKDISEGIAIKEAAKINYFTELGKYFFANPPSEINKNCKKYYDDIKKTDAEIADLKWQANTLNEIKVCTKCQAHITNEDFFCGKCGARLPDNYDFEKKTSAHTEIKASETVEKEEPVKESTIKESTVKEKPSAKKKTQKEPFFFAK